MNENIVVEISQVSIPFISLTISKGTRRLCDSCSITTTLDAFKDISPEYNIWKEGDFLSFLNSNIPKLKKEREIRITYDGEEIFDGICISYSCSFDSQNYDLKIDCKTKEHVLSLSTLEQKAERYHGQKASDIFKELLAAWDFDLNFVMREGVKDKRLYNIIPRNGEKVIDFAQRVAAHSGCLLYKRDKKIVAGNLFEEFKSLSSIEIKDGITSGSYSWKSEGIYDSYKFFSKRLATKQSQDLLLEESFDALKSKRSILELNKARFYDQSNPEAMAPKPVEAFKWVPFDISTRSESEFRYRFSKSISYSFGALRGSRRALNPYLLYGCGVYLCQRKPMIKDVGENLDRTQLHKLIDYEFSSSLANAYGINLSFNSWSVTKDFGKFNKYKILGLSEDMVIDEMVVTITNEGGVSCNAVFVDLNTYSLNPSPPRDIPEKKRKLSSESEASSILRSKEKIWKEFEIQ